MTDTPEGVVVTQEAREAAFGLAPHFWMPVDPVGVLAGQHDEHALVQAFARFQALVAHTAAPRTEEVERLAYLEAEARRFAGMYPEASDWRNTFVIFADKIAALASLPPSDVHTRQGGEDWPLRARVWTRTSVTPHEKVLEIEGVIDDCHMTTRHTQSMNVADSDVPGLPELYAATPTAPTQTVSADKDAPSVSPRPACPECNDTSPLAECGTCGTLAAPPIAIHGETFPREAVAKALEKLVADETGNAREAMRGEDAVESSYRKGRYDAAQSIGVLFPGAVSALLQERQS